MGKIATNTTVSTTRHALTGIIQQGAVVESIVSLSTKPAAWYSLKVSCARVAAGTAGESLAWQGSGGPLYWRRGMMMRRKCAADADPPLRPLCSKLRCTRFTRSLSAWD